MTSLVDLAHSHHAQREESVAKAFGVTRMINRGLDDALTAAPRPPRPGKALVPVKPNPGFQMPNRPSTDLVPVRRSTGDLVRAPRPAPRPRPDAGEPTVTPPPGRSRRLRWMEASVDRGMRAAFGNGPAPRPAAAPANPLAGWGPSRRQQRAARRAARREASKPTGLPPLRDMGRASRSAATSNLDEATQRADDLLRDASVQANETVRRAGQAGQEKVRAANASQNRNARRMGLAVAGGVAAGGTVPVVVNQQMNRRNDRY